MAVVHAFSGRLSGLRRYRKQRDAPMARPGYAHPAQPGAEPVEVRPTGGHGRAVRFRARVAPQRAVHRRRPPWPTAGLPARLCALGDIRAAREACQESHPTSNAGGQVERTRCSNRIAGTRIHSCTDRCGIDGRGMFEPDHGPALHRAGLERQGLGVPAPWSAANASPFRSMHPPHHPAGQGPVHYAVDETPAARGPAVRPRSGWTRGTPKPDSDGELAKGWATCWPPRARQGSRANRLRAVAEKHGNHRKDPAAPWAATSGCTRSGRATCVQAAHAVVDKADTIACEDLSRP